MTNALQLGPLLLPFTLLLVFTSAGSTLLVGRWLSMDAAANAERVLWRAFLAGVLAARLAFVFEYSDLYLSSPLTILDVRDGGWNSAFGFVAAWMFALHQERKVPELRRPVRRALTVGSVVFVVGMTALALFEPRQKLPNLEFESLESGSVRLAQFEGKPIVVNLWASWCPPCRREMPMLHEAQIAHPEVNFVFLNQGEDAANVASWLDSQRLSLRNVLLDTNRKASATFKQEGYPTTLFFNAKGELVSRRIGELSPATLNQRLKSLNDGRKP